MRSILAVISLSLLIGCGEEKSEKPEEFVKAAPPKYCALNFLAEGSVISSAKIISVEYGHEKYTTGTVELPWKMTVNVTKGAPVLISAEWGVTTATDSSRIQVQITDAHGTLLARSIVRDILGGVTVASAASTCPTEP